MVDWSREQEGNGAEAWGNYAHGRHAAGRVVGDWNPWVRFRVA